jgi:TolA-binding protein
MTQANRLSCPQYLSIVLVLVGFLPACGTTNQRDPSATVAPARTEHVDMEPIKIEATKEGGGLRIEAYDAVELFDQAGVALGEKRFDDAVATYAKLLQSFPDSRYARPSLYNRGLAFIGKRDFDSAVDSFRELVAKYPQHEDAKDALFQLGACLAEKGNWPSSAEVFAQILERKDLSSDDRIEAIARRGFAQFNLSDFDTAEKSFRSALSYQKSVENEERLGTDFYVAFSQYHLGQVFHLRFRSIQLRLPEAQMEKDLDDKARLLLTAQRAYIDTIKLGNPAWASAAGFQVGSLYEELYDAFMHAPIPPELKGEAREVYVEELQNKIRILLEKSLRWQRENLLMIERLGVNTDWAEKSKLAYAKVLQLLDPKAPTWDIKDGPPPAPEAPPTVPAVPSRQQEPSVEKTPEIKEKEVIQRTVL